MRKFIKYILILMLLVFPAICHALSLSGSPMFQAFDSVGTPLSGGKLYTYQPGTTTAKPTYQDRTGITAHTNPIILDSRGENEIWWSGSYKLVLKDSNNTLIWTIDNFSGAGTSGNAYFVDPSNTDQGITGNGSTIKALAMAIGTLTKATIVFPHAGSGVTTAYTVSTALDLSSYPNINFQFENGAQIDGASGVTVYSPANIIAQPNQHIKSGTGALIFYNGGTVYPEWWGAIADGITDSTEAFNTAINLGMKTQLQGGTYLVNAIHSAGYLTLTGLGNDVTYLKSYTANGYAFSERLTTGNWVKHLVMSDLTITGGPWVGLPVSTRNGFVYGDPTSYSAAIEYAGRCEFNRVSFLNLNIAFHKPYGNIGNVFNNCNFVVNNYGVYAELNGVAMHAGCDTFNAGEMSGSYLAAIYIDSALDGTGQTILNGTVIESNSGFGLFVYNYAPYPYVPLTLNDVWFESNHSSSGVTINGVSYPPTDMYFRNTASVVLNRCGIYTITGVTSHIVANNCAVIDTSLNSIDSDSILIETDIAARSYKSSANSIVNSYGAAFGWDAGYSDCLLINPRTTFTFGYTKMAGSHFSGSSPWLFSGTTPVYASGVSDGVIFDSCATLTIPNAYQLYNAEALGSFTATIGRWYVWTCDMKLMTNADLSSIYILNVGGSYNIFVGDMSTLLSYGNWVTIGGIARRSTATETFSFPFITNNSGVEITLRMSAFQVMEFTSKHEAVKYFNARLYQK